MDTKSRKFDRTWVTKTIAFLLAIILFAAAAVKTAGFLFETMENDWDVESCFETLLRSPGKGETQQDVFQRSRAFQRLYHSYVETVLQGALTLGDGSEQAYETYQQNRAAAQDARRDSLEKTAVQNLLGKSGHGSPAAIGWYLQNGYITLEKLGNHDKHYVSGSIEVNGSWFSFIDKDGDMADFDTEYDDWDGDDNWAEHTTQVYDVPDSDESAQSSFDIPQNVQKQLKDGQVAVELCNANISTPQNGYVSYDGYYALTLDADKLMADFRADDESVQLYNENYKDYDRFLNAYDDYRRTLSEMKTLMVAVVDNDTKLSVSNLPKLDGKHFGAGAKEYFEKYSWRASYDFASASADYSEAYEAAFDNDSRWALMLDRFTFAEGANVTVYTALKDEFAGSDGDPVAQLYHTSIVMRGALSDLLRFDLICLGGILLCVLYLLLRAGRRHDDDDLHYMPADGIFTLLRTAINGGICTGLGFAFAGLLIEMYENNLRGWLLFALLGLIAALAMASLINWLQYVVRHIKGHTLFKNLFLVWLVRKVHGWYKRYKENRPKKEKLQVEYADIYKDVKKRVLRLGFLPNAVLGILAVIFMACDVWSLAVITLLAILGYNIWLAVYATRYAYRARAGIEAVHRIRGGDYDVHLAVDETSPALACFARDVNSINDGLRIAVNNALKDERMRTELITNVSHDLKTPLTSIINYVDLLSRCDIPDETAQQYLAVLGDKSARLKKLIEDLVEASKASSGAIRVDLVDMSLAELTNQIVGEYADAFEARNLDLIYTANSDVLVRADSKLCYRVLDNLMGNVKKYAMPGTRVYLDLTQTDTHGVLTLRNVSQSQLNIPVEELLERFVRADESRSTEGSGLGLSIADNLCRLQGAVLHLSISGDLFTAEVSFPKA